MEKATSKRHKWEPESTLEELPVQSDFTSKRLTAKLTIIRNLESDNHELNIFSSTVPSQPRKG